MISRTFDAAFLTSIANHPEIRPHIGPGEQALDLSDLVSNPANIALETEHGGWVLVNLLPGVYELHTLFLPEGRGKSYFKAAREALRYVFAATDCLEIVTRCPDDNPQAKMAANLVGFRERARRGDVSHQAFTLDDWLQRDQEIEEDGASVMCAVEAAMGHGITLDDDPLLNRLVGAVVLMMRAGQTPKAMAMFARAATIYGYAPIVALRGDVIDIGGALVAIKPEGVGVLPTS